MRRLFFTMNMKTVTLFLHSIVLIYSGLVQSSEDIKPPILRCQPKKDLITYTNLTNSIFIPCEAEGENVKNPLYTYRWKKDGVDIQKTMEHITTITDCNFGLNILKSPEINEGTYQCFVSNKHGTAMSNPVTLQKYEFSSSRASKTATVGTSIKLTCADSQNSEGLEQNYWVHEEPHQDQVWNNPIREDSRRILDPHGNLWILSVEPGDSSNITGPYVYVTPEPQSQHSFCRTTLHVVHSSASDASPSDPPMTYFSKEDEWAVWGKNKKLFCIYDKRFNIIWKKDDQILESNDKNVRVAESQTSVEITNFQEENEGNYTCEVVKATNNEVQYRHHSMVKIGKPFFKKELKKLEIVEGTNATFSCEAYDSKSSEREVSIQWIYNGAAINKTGFFDIKFSNNDSVLEIENCQEKHIGTYGCNASNIHGSVYKEGYIYVQKRQPPKRDESIEYDANKTLSINLGDTLNLTCPVIPAFPKTDMRIEWTRKNKEILSNETDFPRITIKKEGKLLQIKNVTSDDATEYMCIVYHYEVKCLNYTFNFILNPEPRTEESNTFFTILLCLIGLVVIAAIILAILIVNKKRGYFGETGVYNLRKREHEAANKRDPKTPDQNEVAVLTETLGRNEKLKLERKSTENGMTLAQMESTSLIEVQCSN